MPPFAGVVEKIEEKEKSYHGLLVRLDEPGPGIASLFALPMGGQVFLVIDRFFRMATEPPAIAARDQPLWQSWMQKHFPSPSNASNVT